MAKRDKYIVAKGKGTVLLAIGGRYRSPKFFALQKLLLCWNRYVKWRL
jgi:hypothetical protein